MKSHSTRNPLVSYRNKVMPFSAFAFFLCLTVSNAQSNETTGDDGVYGNVDKVVISTADSGTADLIVRDPATTGILLDEAVIGSITISNNFSSFDIDATEGTLTGIDAATLSVQGGTNLTINGGTFSGGTYELGTNDWISSEGAVFSNVRTALVSEAVFQGKTITNNDSDTGDGPAPPSQSRSPNASGSSGLVIQNGTYADLSDVIIGGGDGATAAAYQSEIRAIGGTGLEIYDSTAILSNATITGGNGGDATAYNSFDTYASGGHAIYATNSVLEIKSGTFTGGDAGTANRSDPTGGAGLIAVGGSSITNYAGKFTGSDTFAVYLENSDLTSFGGTYKNGGLYSQTTGSGTNKLDLLGGTFSTLSFMNETSNGMQFVTASNIVVSTDIYQDGGTVEITNLEDDGFQDIIINDGTMIFNNDLALAANATLTLSDSTSKIFFQGLEVGSDSQVNVSLGQIEAAGDIDVLSGASLNFQIVTNRSGLISANAISFESNATVSVDATLAGFSTGSTNITLISTASAINSNFISEVQLTQNTNVAGRTSLGSTIVDNNLTYQFVTLSLSNYWEATDDLAELADELEGLASPEMNVLINNLGADASKALVEETYFTTMNTFQTTKQGLDAAIGLSLSRGTEFRDQLRLPKGAKGPNDPENDWRFWAKYYGQFYHRDADGLNPEYDSTMHGGVIGMDKSFGHLLVGLSGGIGNYSIETESDAEQDMNAFQGAIYSTVGKEHAYLDAGLGFGFNSVESKTAEPFTLESEFDTQLVSAHLGGGYGFEFSGIGTVITPEAAVRYTMYQQDDYTEEGTLAVPRSFDEFDTDSLVGTFGLNASMLNATALKAFAFKIEGRAHWMREFNPEPGSISYQLVGGANEYIIAYPNLDEDTVRLGLGFTFFNTNKRAGENVLLRLDFDELFGKDFNSHNLSAKVIYAF